MFFYITDYACLTPSSIKQYDKIFAGVIDWSVYTPTIKVVHKIPSQLKALIYLTELLIDKVNSKDLAIIGILKYDFLRDSASSVPSPYAFNSSNSIALLCDLFKLSPKAIICLDNTCTTSLDALLIAQSLFQANIASQVLVIGLIDYSLSSRSYYHYKLNVLSKSGSVKPFDKSRDGTIFSDAALVCYLSKWNSDNAIAEVQYVSQYKHIRRDQNLFTISEDNYFLPLFYSLDKFAPDLIKAHGSGTILNDRIEALAYSRIYSDSIPITAFKHFIGHTSMLSGLLETCLLFQGIPLLSYLREPEIPLKFTTGNDVLLHFTTKVLSVATGFGGLTTLVGVEFTHPLQVVKYNTSEVLHVCRS